MASYDYVQDILNLWDQEVFSKNDGLFKKYNLYYGLNFKENNKLKSLNSTFLYSETFEWSLSLEKWITQIDSQYILLLLDDHIIKTFSLSTFDLIIKDIHKNNVLYAPITYGTNILRRIINIKGFIKGKVLNDKYSINLQPSIWEKHLILKLLKKTITPWDFEINSSKEYNKEKFKAYFYITKNIAFFEQYIERGRVYPKRFLNIFKKDYLLFINRDSVDLKRRIISHLGYIYKILKEFINTLKSLIIYK